MDARLYDAYAFGKKLIGDLRPSSIRSLVKLYLREGAHPFFLRQAIRMAASKSSDTYERTMGAANEALADYQRPREFVPNRRVGDSMGALSRLFDEHGDPRDIKDLGIAHGAIAEALADIVDAKQEDFPYDFLRNWDNAASLIVQNVSALPYADFSLFDTLYYVMHAIEELIKGKMSPAPSLPDELKAIMSSKRADFGDSLDAFFLKRAGRLGISGAVMELASAVWSPGNEASFWGYLTLLMRHFGKQSFQDLPFTQIIETLLGLKGLGHAATQILNGYPANEPQREHFGVRHCFVAMASFRGLAGLIVGELSNPRTRHAIIRWMQRVSERTRFQLLLAFTFGKHQAGVYCIDGRAEAVIEDAFGPSAWKALCDLQDDSCWDFVTEDLAGGIPYREGIKQSLPQYVEVERAVRHSPLARHDSDVAEAFEAIIAGSSIQSAELLGSVEANLNLLSGEIVSAVSHLYDSWMPLQRKPKELLGAKIQGVQVCRHPMHGDRGAACKFRIPLVDLNNKFVCGSLDPDGELTLDNAPIMDDEGKLAVRAIAIDSLRSLLVPTLVESLPPVGAHGFLIVTGEPMARRPLIHTLGELGKKRDEEGPSLGSRINPIMAMMLFRWLLGQLPEYEFRLYSKAEDDGGGKGAFYFKTLRAAKESLIDKRRTLSEVFMRAVRAHAQPLPAYLDQSNTVRVWEMSERAKRNYDYYRQDGGRELSFSPIRKTYILPSGVRIPIDVPKTFNQGCFASLEEASRLIFDPSLKNAIEAKFAVGK